MRAFQFTMRHQRGAGLVEVMVAVLILGFGMLGIAALQAITLRNSQSSLERSQAVMQSYSIFDAMRANASVARSDGYDMDRTCKAPDTGDLSANDRARWITSLQATVGSSACGSIACTGADCTVTVEWNDERGSGGNAAQTIITQGRI